MRWDVMGRIPDLWNQCDGAVGLMDEDQLSLSVAVRGNQRLHLLIRD